MKYRKKPVLIEAVQWTGKNWEDVVEFINGATKSVVNMVEESVDILTLEGTMRTSKGDWIIRGIKGEIYPCKHDIFEATYEAAES